jgi:hypothetical protein
MIAIDNTSTLNGQGAEMIGKSVTGEIPLLPLRGSAIRSIDAEIILLLRLRQLSTSIGEVALTIGGLPVTKAVRSIIIIARNITRDHLIPHTNPLLLDHHLPLLPQLTFAVPIFNSRL